MFRVSIRDILWLTLVVALGVSWLSEQSTARKLTTRYNSLCNNVRWCPPGLRIVFNDDDGVGYRLERHPSYQSAWKHNATVWR